MLDRIAVFAATPVATFLTLLLELLLCFGVGEAQAKLDASLLAEEAVVLADDTLSYFTRLEPGMVRQGWLGASHWTLPGKSNFLADT